MANPMPTDQQIYGTLYESDLFLETIEQEFKCAICLCVLKDAQQLLCEHMFCRVCITSYFQSSPANNYCPIDREAATAADVRSAPRAIRNLIARFEVKCRYYGDGCTAQMALEELDRHDELCRFGPCFGHTDQLPTDPNRDVVAIETAALPMTIYVKLADSSKTMVLTASANDSVLTLKRRIQEKEGIDANTLALNFGTKPLDNRHLLIKYNIKNGSVVWSSRRFNGGVAIISFD